MFTETNLFNQSFWKAKYLQAPKVLLKTRNIYRIEE